MYTISQVKVNNDHLVTIQCSSRTLDQQHGIHVDVTWHAPPTQTLLLMLGVPSLMSSVLPDRSAPELKVSTWPQNSKIPNQSSIC